jgi:Ca-activated chloride channel family protein
MGSSLLATRAWSVFQLWALPFFLTAICAVSGHPQVASPTANDRSDTIISVDVRLVVLHASVRNKRGDIVLGLQQRNFRVDEDGRPQTIQAFHPEDTPVAVGLVVDNSGSMTRKRPDVTAAAVAFARSSNPDDHMFVVNFNEHPTLGLPDLKLFSASAAELEGALLRPQPSGRTALYDAISDALAHVRRSIIERKALVVISDGGDNASTHTLNQLLRDITQSDVIVYTIGLFDREDPDVNPRALQRIANASGGQAFLPKVSAEAEKICRNIARDIRTQYAISYSPSNQKFGGEYRTIRVSVTGDHGAKLQARTRAGYVASQSGSAAKEGRQ